MSSSPYLPFAISYGDWESGKQVVCATFKSHSSVLQMGLCLVWGVEFPNVTLPDNLAEAAFALAERANPESGMARPAHGALGAHKAGQDVPMADTKEDCEDPEDVHIALRLSTRSWR